VIEINHKNLILTLICIISLTFSIASGFAFSTLSVSQNDFVSNDNYLDGKAWLLTVSEDGNSQSAKGTIQGEKLKTDDGGYAKSDLTIKTEVTEQSCDYNLRQNYDPDIYVYNLQLIKSNAWSWELDKYIDQCEDKSQGAWGFIEGKYNYYIYNVYCLTKHKIGVPGSIKSPTTNFEAKLTVQKDSDSKTATISSTSAKSVKLSNVAYAHWAGSLSSGEQCPDPGSEGYMIVHDETGNWVLTKSRLYDSYLSYKQNTFDDFIYDDMADEISRWTGVSIDTIDNLQSRINDLNSRANNAITEFGYSDFRVTSNSLSSGQAHIELDRTIQFPVITMHVKADWLGIVIPVGEPKITSISAEDFEEGKNGQIKVTVKNIGDATASFGISASCESPIKQVGTAQTISNLRDGSQKTVTITLSGATNKEVTKKCTVNVYDLNNPDMKDSDTVTVTLKPIRLCDPGETRCDGETQKICNKDGSAWEKTDSKACIKPDCTKDSECADNSACTQDKCVSGKCENTYVISSTCPGEKFCVYSVDGNEYNKVTTEKDCCELQGGRYDPGVQPAWYEFWKSAKEPKCYISKISLFAILAMVAGGVLLGFGQFYWGGMSIFIGIVWFILKLLGY
jgi:hypothetical protein